MTMSSKILAAALMAASASWLIAPAAAAPLSSSLGLRNTVAPSVETVQYRRGWRGGYYRHGAIVGGAVLGATHPYGYDRYDSSYDYAPGYVAPYAGGNEVDYCQQRFRSYDPASGTYLGFDGLRHPCP
jgi:hypothetical protein